MMEKYKFMVIGGGTSGLSAAIRLSKKDKTLLIEPTVLGGTCLNNGCIPTKAMLHASELYASTKEMSFFGVNTKSDINFKKLMSRVNSIPKEGRDHINAGVAKNNNLIIVKGKAKFISKKVVEVKGKEYSADTIIIATGAKNFVPPIKGIESIDYLDNESVLNLKELPKKVVMIGGGYISMEYATFFSELGSKVIVLERLPKILAMLDDDINNLAVSLFQKKGIEIRTNINIIEVEKNKITFNDVRDQKSKPESIGFDKVFLAAGRVPNTNYLEPEKSGITLGKRKEIFVDKFLETSIKGIYAIGDVNNLHMFAHAAKKQLDIVLNNIFEKKKPYDSIIPWSVFVHPPISGVGLSEKQLLDDNVDYGILKTNYKNGRTKILEREDGLVKVMYDKKTKRILGSVILGENSDDIIHEIAALLNAKSTVDVLQNMVHIHPTVSEIMAKLS